MKIENEYIKIQYCERGDCANVRSEYQRLKRLCRDMENENSLLLFGLIPNLAEKGELKLGHWELIKLHVDNLTEKLAMQEQKFLWAQEQIEKTGLHKTNDALRVVVEAN